MGVVYAYSNGSHRKIWGFCSISLSYFLEPGYLTEPGGRLEAVKS